MKHDEEPPDDEDEVQPWPGPDVILMPMQPFTLILDDEKKIPAFGAHTPHPDLVFHGIHGKANLCAVWVHPDCLPASSALSQEELRDQVIAGFQAASAIIKGTSPGALHHFANEFPELRGRWIAFDGDGNGIYCDGANLMEVYSKSRAQGVRDGVLFGQVPGELDSGQE